MSISSPGYSMGVINDILLSELPRPAAELIERYAGLSSTSNVNDPASSSLVPSNNALVENAASQPYIIQVHGGSSTYLVSYENMTASSALKAAGRVFLASCERIEDAFIRNIPESTRNNYDPQYHAQYHIAGLIAYSFVSFASYLLEATSAAVIGYGATCLTGSVAAGAVMGGAVFSTLQVTAVLGGYYSLLKDAFYSNLDFNVRVVNFIYDNGLSLHWHSLMLNAQSIWGSVTAEKLNNTPRNRWIHIHPRIVKRLPVEDYSNLDPRIIAKFRPELKNDIDRYFANFHQSRAL